MPEGTPRTLTKRGHTHTFGCRPLQLEKVIVESAQVFSTSLRGKPDVEEGTVGPQDDAVLGERA